MNFSVTAPTFGILGAWRSQRTNTGTLSEPTAQSGSPEPRRLKVRREPLTLYDTGHQLAKAIHDLAQGQTLVVGSSKEADFQISRPKDLLPLHAIFYHLDTGYWVQPFDENATVVYYSFNDKQMLSPRTVKPNEMSKLLDNDRVQLGNFFFRIQA